MKCSLICTTMASCSSLGSVPSIPSRSADSGAAQTNDGAVTGRLTLSEANVDAYGATGVLLANIGPGPNAADSSAGADRHNAAENAPRSECRQRRRSLRRQHADGREDQRAGDGRGCRGGRVLHAGEQSRRTHRQLVRPRPRRRRRSPERLIQGVAEESVPRQSGSRCVARQHRQCRKHRQVGRRTDRSRQRHELEPDGLESRVLQAQLGRQIPPGESQAAHRRHRSARQEHSTHANAPRRGGRRQRQGRDRSAVEGKEMEARAHRLGLAAAARGAVAACLQGPRRRHDHAHLRRYRRALRDERRNANRSARRVRRAEAQACRDEGDLLQPPRAADRRRDGCLARPPHGRRHRRWNPRRFRR